MAYTFEILVVIFSLVLFCYFYRNKNGLPTNWPLIGMLPALLINVHRIHIAFIEVLEKSNLTFQFKGPWFTNMDTLATLDLANIQHIMSKNSTNYPKGVKFQEMFDVLGDGILNADFILWEYQRKIFQNFVLHPNFHQLLVTKTFEKINNGLIPVFDHVFQHGIEVDLQNLFARFSFDNGFLVLMNHDPKSLAIDLPPTPQSDALDDVEEVIFYRHLVPPFIWKFQRWLNIGKENKYKRAWKILDDFIYKYIALRREQMMSKKQSYSKHDNQGNNTNYNNNNNNNNYNELSDLLTIYMQEVENNKTPISKNGDKFIRDSVLTNFIAGRDAISITLSWFFYLVSKYPQVASKIKHELENVKLDWTNFKEVNMKPVYLHATLCETMRLYAPIAFTIKSPAEQDVLPSGHCVDPSVQIIFNIHALGRIKSIWGEDCDEFKPERWITDEGKIKHEPSFKYFVFNSGPRACPGKNMSFTQMKIVAATILQNYVIEPVQGQSVVPKKSIFLGMENGFKVRVFRSSPIDELMK